MKFKTFLKRSILNIRVDPNKCDSYLYAKENIKCATPLCGCPAREAKKYSFRYVDEVRKCIYYDVPKSASSTIRKKLDVGSVPHLTSLSNPRLELQSYFKFSIVRNPWDRMFSNWKMFTTQPGRIRQLQSMTSQNLNEFSSFVRFAVENPNHHWQPQADFVPAELDYLGKMEEMEQALICLSENINNFDASNIKLNKSEPGVNDKQGIHYREYYSPDIMDLVADFYAEDIRRFGYAY